MRSTNQNVGLSMYGFSLKVSLKHFIYSKTAKLWKSGAALTKAWVKKVGKSKVAAKNGCNDVNANKF